MLTDFEQIYQKINTELRSFIQKLIEECKQVLGPPPCGHAFICFGSLARDEATPYSDLEFGVLLKEGADNETNKNYFRRLTQLLNIKVLNLGETTPRMQDIAELREIGLCGRYSVPPNKPGFSFDGNNAGGRKTPLGNAPFAEVPEEEKYELIRTPKQMAQLHNEAWFAKDRHLSTVLMAVKTLAGDATLTEAYQQEMDAILQSPVSPQHQPHFNENISHKTLLQQRSWGLLKESVERHQFRGGHFG
jgi:predicted nucleotidyltransferase